MLLDKRSIGIGVFIVALVTGASAQEMALRASPVPPLPTGGLCVNKVTGAARVILDKNNLVLPCRKTENSVAFATVEASSICVNKITGAVRVIDSCSKASFGVVLDTLADEPLPSPGNSPSASPSTSVSPSPSGSPSASPSASASVSPSPAPTAQPTVSVLPSEMRDSNGKLVGYVLDDDTIQGSPATAVAMNINGQEFAIAATSAGFPDNSLDPNANNADAVYYSGSNCMGTAYMEFAPDDNTSADLNPLIISAVEDDIEIAQTLQTAFIADQVLFYPAQPYSNIPVQSLIANPTFNSDGTVSGDCAAVQANPTSIYGGLLTNINLANLGFTPPFTTVAEPSGN
jgi:hypothetical protein